MFGTIIATQALPPVHLDRAIWAACDGTSGVFNAVLPAPRAVRFAYHLIGDRDRRIGYIHLDSIDMNRSCAARQAAGGALFARRPSFSGPSSLTALPWKAQSRKPRHA